MLKSSLLEIIRTFSKQELIKFEDFVSSPYFNKKENVIKLFLVIKKYAPELSDENLAKEELWRKLFFVKEYNYGIMKNLIFDLNQLSEKFIRLEFSEKNIIRKEYDLMESLFDKNILNLFTRKFSAYEKMCNEENFENSNLETEEIYHFLSNAYSLKSWCDYSFNSDSDYRNTALQSSKYLIYSFLINCFKNYNNLKARVISKRVSVEKDYVEFFFEKLGNKEIEDILNHGENTDDDKSYILMKCFNLMFRCLSSDNNIKNYFDFKNALEKYTNKIPKRDLSNFYTSLASILEKTESRKINVFEEFVWIYKAMMKNNFFLESNGMLREYRFNLYVYYSSTAENYDEMLKFISENLDKIPNDSRQNSFNFAMAVIHFAKSEFKKSLEYISLVNEKYFDMKHRIKNMLLMIYYELNDYESFTYSLDSNKHFTNKNKAIDESRKESGKTFLDLINRLFKQKDNYKGFEFKKLESEINDSDISQREWLLIKIKELKELK